MSFTTTRPGVVKVGVYDLRGRLVRSLFEGGMTAGTQREYWDGADASGSAVGSGIYLVRMKGETGQASTKLMLVK